MQSTMSAHAICFIDMLQTVYLAVNLSCLH